MDGSFSWILAVCGFCAGIGFAWAWLNERRRSRQLVARLQEAQRLQSAADEADRRKSDFLATVSHELRTPLNALNGFADLLLSGTGVEGGAVQGDHRELVFKIKANSERLLWGVNEILEMSRLEANRVELDLMPCNIQELVESVRSRMASLAMEKGLDLSCQVDEIVPAEVIGDIDHLERILVNLVGNAIKFTEQGSVLVWITLKGTEKLEIRVIDTGIGLEQDQLNRIFEPFVQIDTGKNHQQGGTGLGLSIVRELVRILGGFVRVEKTEIGRGTTFLVVLPLLPADNSSKLALEVVT